MKTLEIIHGENNKIFYKTDFGVFSKELVYHGFSSHTYNVDKLSGEWPPERELGNWLDDRFDFFGGRVNIIDETRASALCYVD